MPKIGTLDFTGISGHIYTFNVYPMNGSLKEKRAVYFVTKRLVKADTSVDHIILYVGETDNLSKHFKSHELSKEFGKELANCVCVHWEEHEDTRQKIKEDLLNMYHPPYNIIS